VYDLPQKHEGEKRMLGELYSPSGMALETAKAVLGVDNPHAVNVALGCPNGCTYCYGPLASRQGREKYSTPRLPKKDPVDLVRYQIDKGLKVDGVFMSFLTDPYLPQLEKKTEELVYYLREQGIPTATLSKLGTSTCFGNMNGMTIVSPYKEFSLKYESGVPSPQDRILKLGETLPHATWVSMEPWPVSDIFAYTLPDILNFWEDLSFVGFMVLGKWNYDKRARTEKARQEYAKIVPLFEDFCNDHGIRYHVKSDTLRFIGRDVPPEVERVVVKCCGSNMVERVNFDGTPIYWCVSCGKKKLRTSQKEISE